MSPQKEGLRILLGRSPERRGLLFDPKTMPFSALRQMIANKVRSTEDTDILMGYPTSSVYVDSAKLHEINHLPQQQKIRAIQRIANQISCSDFALVSSDIVKLNK